MEGHKTYGNFYMAKFDYKIDMVDDNFVSLFTSKQVWKSQLERLKTCIPDILLISKVEHVKLFLVFLSYN